MRRRSRTTSSPPQPQTVTVAPTGGVVEIVVGLSDGTTVTIPVAPFDAIDFADQIKTAAGACADDMTIRAVPADLAELAR